MAGELSIARRIALSQFRNPLDVLLALLVFVSLRIGAGGREGSLFAANAQTALQLATALQPSLSGLRWQLIPLYTASAILLLPPLLVASDWRGVVSVRVCVYVLLAVTALLLVLFPSAVLPRTPQGGFDIGEAQHCLFVPSDGSPKQRHRREARRASATGGAQKKEEGQEEQEEQEEDAAAGIMALQVKLFYPTTAAGQSLRMRPSLAALAATIGVVAGGTFPGTDKAAAIAAESKLPESILWALFPLGMLMAACILHDLSMLLVSRVPYLPPPLPLPSATDEMGVPASSELNKMLEEMSDWRVKGPTAQGASVWSMVVGFARFAKLPPIFFSHMPFFSIFATHEAPLAGPEACARVPVIVFSHGLGGSMTCYSSLATELASHGYLVVCIEHNDGTAACTMLPGLPPRMYEFYKGPANSEEERTFRQRRLRRRMQELHLVLQFLQVLNTAQVLLPELEDASSTGEDGDDLSDDDMAVVVPRHHRTARAVVAQSDASSLRHRRRQQRQRHAPAAAGAATAGSAPPSDEAARAARLERAKASTAGLARGWQFREIACNMVPEVSPRLLRTFSGRLDLDDITFMGHSFGGATVLHTLLTRAWHDWQDYAGARGPFSRAIVLDPWFFPLQRSLLYDVEGPATAVAERRAAVSAPLLVVHASDWQWADNLRDEETLVRQRTDPSAPVVHMRIRNTAHNNYSDFGVMSPVVTRAMGIVGRSDPDTQIGIIASALLDFMEHTPVALSADGSEAPSSPSTPAGPASQSAAREAVLRVAAEAKDAWELRRHDLFDMLYSRVP
jgi:hypothetical protein